MPTNHRHDAVREVSIQREIGRETDDSLFFHKAFYLIERHAHFDAECFGFVTARDHTTVVAREHHNRLPLQIGTEDTLAGNEEIIAISQGEHIAIKGGFCELRR